MTPTSSRRGFLATAATAALASRSLARGAASGASVVVWDERQPAQKSAYDNFLGNQIAAHLRAATDLEVASVALDDPGQGLSDERLDAARVLVWWGHVRQAEVKPELGRAIVARIKAGALALVALHSAHWSTPFMHAMNERALEDLRRDQPAAGDAVKLVPPPRPYVVPGREARLTPYAEPRKFPDGKVTIDLHLPFCCFPAYRNDGKPSQVRVLKPDHPIVRGVPPVFEIPREEMYDEPFHVPPPDEVILEERWESGEWFRSGMLWKVGKGTVFYFRPGHETYPTYKEEHPLRIVTNAVRWLAS
jgi:trehalose utilization protein